MKKLIYLSMVVLLFCGSCKKFLDEKSNQNQAIPETLTDLQALLDQYQVLNYVDGNAAEISTDDVYLNDADLAARPENERNMYTWQRSNIFLQDGNEWFYNYRAINRTNVVLEAIAKIGETAGNAGEWDNVCGQAYFIRAKNHLRGLYIWGNAYGEQSQSDLGIPLRLGSDFNVPSVRATVAQGYAQVISDLQRAAQALPLKAVHVMRPARPAAYGMLARVYLSMRNYELAKLYADSCLSMKADLLDYNNLNAAASYPIGQFNVEVLQDSYFTAPMLNSARGKINPALYALYEANDLRKTVFFTDNKNGTYGFKGSYEGNSNFFSGVAVNEVLLIRSECLARAGRLSEALADLNRLLRNRYKKNTFIDRAGSDQQAVLTDILIERRKELLLRGLRWVDVKRLNMENAGISFSRSYKGVTYQLKANSTGFALPIPERVIEVAGLPQNP
ncbi:hypothetical protein OC25_23765 [Pedobacter kyungheensis]|uniref:Uncharacterized protein n=1 Tax=Pedobacter kyungheensis TaxID=1069985 RepID=A0A0C1DAD3_9SPHI|nr:RagB/SusD family nutrient uptake outer membrane protein [Pedobacter kyungheensis]KIA90920.1 hypothetical protein OC25_23765 [Pedobacter kyungheensis]